MNSEGHLFCKKCKHNMSLDATTWLGGFYTVRLLAVLCGVDPATVYKWARRDPRVIRRWRIVLFPPYVAQEYYERHKAWIENHPHTKKGIPRIEDKKKFNSWKYRQGDAGLLYGPTKYRYSRDHFDYRPNKVASPDKKYKATTTNKKYESKKEGGRRYYERNKEAYREYTRRWRRTHRKYDPAYYQEHRTEIRAWQKSYHARKKARLAGE